MTLRIPAKVLIHVWSYDFYDMTLSTGKQRRHMIIFIIEASVVLCYVTRLVNQGSQVRSRASPVYRMRL